MKQPKRNLLGKTYGDWTPIKFAGFNKNRDAEWLCECKCKLQKNVLANYLIRGDSTCCVSCSHKKKIKKGRLIPYSYFNTLKQNAKKRDISFNLTIEDIYSCYIEQNKKCKLTGLDIVWANTEGEHLKKCTIASVDRINPKLGYSIDNIQIVHKTINIMKNVLSNDEFKDFCKKVVNHEAQSTVSSQQPRLRPSWNKRQ